MKNKILSQDIETFCKNFDIDYQTKFVREYALIGDSKIYGGKHCGSDAEHEGSKFIAGKLKEIGLSNVELLPCKTARYQFNDATIKIKDESAEIKPYGYVSPGTEKTELELIDLGKATREECEKADIDGKAAMFAAMGTLEGGNLAGQMEEATNHGAAAVIIYAVEDVLNEETIRVQPPNIISRVPIVGICRKDAERLKKKISEGGCTIDITVDAEFIPDGGTTYNVVGEIPGSCSDEKIIYTAHLDHYFRCLQDNISSCSTLLGIAKSVLDSGIKPNRTLVFAFHGSHETGGQDTRYPYIYGSYKLTHESKAKWTGSAIMNINFEYTALAQKKFQMLAYMGNNATVKQYFEYSPELTGGFTQKVKDASQEEYYMLSWADGISYYSAGIPTVMNDPITEQLYEGTGPYVGRDHSNHDNEDAFDEKALEDNGRMYGGLGLFIDSMPYMIMDFTEQTDRIRRETDTELLASLEMPTDDYMSAVGRLEKAAVKINAYVSERNDEYIKALSEGMSDEEKVAWFEAGRDFNKKILDAYKDITDNLDKINQFDFLCLATVKYSQNIRLMQAAVEYLNAIDPEKALGEYLSSVDLCMSSYYFSEDVAEHMRKQICDPSYKSKRTWAAGRELHVATNYELMETLRKETEAGKGFANTLKALNEAISTEISYIPDAMEAEIATLKVVAEKLEDIIREV